MGSNAADDLEGGDQGADLAYRWTVRTLYVVAIALNVWVLWDQLAEDADAKVVKAKVNAWMAKALRPFHLDRQVKREAGAVIFEAMQVVEEAESGQ
jgi:hypothetical protein